MGSRSKNGVGLNEAVDDFQRKLILDALRQTRTLRQAAALLKLKLTTLCYQMQRLGIERSVEVSRTVSVRVHQK